MKNKFTNQSDNSILHFNSTLIRVDDRQWLRMIVIISAVVDIFGVPPNDLRFVIAAICDRWSWNAKCSSCTVPSSSRLNLDSHRGKNTTELHEWVGPRSLQWSKQATWHFFELHPYVRTYVHMYVHIVSDECSTCSNTWTNKIDRWSYKWYALCSEGFIALGDFRCESSANINYTK